MTKAAHIMEKLAKFNKYTPHELGGGWRTDIDQYRKGKVIKEDDKTVHFQIPKSNIPFHRSSVGIMNNDFKTNRLVKEREFSGGKKDTVFTTAHPIKHLFTKDVRRK